MTIRFANTAIGIGLVVLLYSALLTVQRYNPTRLTFAAVPAQNTSQSALVPDRVVIKSVGIDTRVIRAPYFEKRWELTPHGASWLETSPIPGERGNSIVYGHNWSAIFLNLTKVKPGDYVEVYMSDGSRRVFAITATQVVSPSETGVLNPTTSRQLTLYTCTGFLDTKRFVAAATLQSEIAATSL